MELGHISINGSRLRNIIYLTAIIGGYIVFFYISSKAFGKNITTCPFMNITGISCPGCGMGHATLELSHFNFIGSLMLHPLAIPFNVVVLISVFWLLKDTIKGRDSFQKFVKSKPKNWVIIFLSIVVLSVWIRNIFIGL